MLNATGGKSMPSGQTASVQFEVVAMMLTTIANDSPQKSIDVPCTTRASDGSGSGCVLVSFIVTG